MRRTLAVSCTVLASLALLAGCSGSGAGSGSGAKPTGPTTTAKSGELDKLMRTKMNASYSQLVFLVFHAEEPDFDAIATEGAKLSDAIAGVLQLQVPPVAQSDQARQVYVDYNETLRRDNEKFVAASADRDLTAMSTSLTKIGETCSACHHFFRVEKVEIKK
jgi:cytochrome c556